MYNLMDKNLNKFLYELPYQIEDFLCTRTESRRARK